MNGYPSNPLGEKIWDAVDHVSDWLFSNDRFLWIGIAGIIGLIVCPSMAKNLWIPLFFG